METNQLSNLEEILNNNEFRYLFLATLISADTIIDEESANQSLKHLNYIKDNLDNLNLFDNIKEEVIKFVNKGIQIVENDLVTFRKIN